MLCVVLLLRLLDKRIVKEIVMSWNYHKQTTLKKKLFLDDFSEKVDLR